MEPRCKQHLMKEFVGQKPVAALHALVDWLTNNYKQVEIIGFRKGIEGDHYSMKVYYQKRIYLFTRSRN
jgi:hypothetical protein